MRLFCRGHRVAAISVAQGTESYGIIGELNKLVRNGIMVYAAWFVALEATEVAWVQWGPALKGLFRQLRGSSLKVLRYLYSPTGSFLLGYRSEG